MVVYFPQTVYDQQARNNVVPKIEQNLPITASASISFRRDAPLPDLAFLALFVLMAVCHLAAALLARGWMTAVITDGIVLTYLLGVMQARPEWRPLIGRLMLFGLIAGIAELATDAAGAQVAHSLVYPAEEPMIWQSPAYMPISWMIVLTLLGYLCWRLANLLPMGQAAALGGLAGMLIVPFYEESAWYAGWWRYTTLPRIGHTPVYVFLFEGGIVAIIPLLLRGVERLAPRWVAARGLLLGGWMPLVAFVSWRLLGQG
jgi:uncharacterized protein DUF6989